MPVHASYNVAFVWSPIELAQTNQGEKDEADYCVLHVAKGDQRFCSVFTRGSNKYAMQLVVLLTFRQFFIPRLYDRLGVFSVMN